jgi:hypothetical protein
MKRHALKSEATQVIDNRSTGVRQTVVVQVLGPGTVFITTVRNDLYHLDNNGSPVNGLRLTQLNSVQDGRFMDFLGEMWMRSDQNGGTDVDITINNSTNQAPDKPRMHRPYISTHAPRWGGH